MPLRALCLIAEELGGADALLQAVPDGFGGGLAGAGPGGPGRLALALHRLAERVRVDADSARLQGVLRQVQGETVGVVEGEGGLAREVLARRQVAGLGVQDCEAALQGAAKPSLLQAQGLGDEALGPGQFRVGLSHLAQQGRHEAEHHGLARAQKLGVAHGAAHDAAQDVAPALIAGQHAVRHQEGGGPQVVGDDPVGGDVARLGRTADRVAHGVDEDAEQVRVVVALHALEDRRHALQAHPGIDGRARQGEAVARLDLLVLHEHEVPELEEAVAVLVRRTGRSALERRALVDEDLRAGAAGPGIAHLPEIVGRCRCG